MQTEPMQYLRRKMEEEHGQEGIGVCTGQDFCPLRPLPSGRGVGSGSEDSDGRSEIVSNDDFRPTITVRMMFDKSVLSLRHSH